LKDQSQTEQEPPRDGNATGQWKVVSTTGINAGSPSSAFSYLLRAASRKRGRSAAGLGRLCWHFACQIAGERPGRAGSRAAKRKQHGDHDDQLQGDAEHNPSWLVDID